MRCPIAVCSHCSMQIPLAHKPNIPGNSDFDFVRSGDPDAILIAPAVSDHDSFEIARIQFLGLFLGHMDECLCANSNEMRNVGPPAVEGLVRGSSIES